MLERIRMFLFIHAEAVLIAAMVVFAIGFVACVGASPAYHVQSIEVKDGDTAKVSVEVWPDVVVTTAVRVRGINTPESSRSAASAVCGGPCVSGDEECERQRRLCIKCELQAGQVAKEWAKNWITGKQCVLANVDPKESKYAGRVGGDILCDGRMWGEDIIAAGYAKAYRGEKRASECLR